MPPEKRPGPPELEHLVQRLEEEGHSPAGEGEPEPPETEPIDDPDKARARTVVAVLGLVVIVVIWLGPELKPPYNSVALLTGAALCFLLAYLERFLAQTVFMWIDICVGMTLLGLGIGPFLR